MPVLLYDGDCGFCTTSVRFIERRIPTRAELRPYQFTDLDALGATPKRASAEVLWVDGTRISGGAQAVARLLIDAGGAWRVLGALLRIPPFRWLAAGVYHVVTVNRYRLPGGTPACALPASARPGRSSGRGGPRGGGGQQVGHGDELKAPRS
jgi:predicted DCC family thiol-disulfide oxidoreductase YuxK